MHVFGTNWYELKEPFNKGDKPTFFKGKESKDINYRAKMAREERDKMM